MPVCTQAVEALRRIGKIENVEPLMKPPVACPQPFKYRNKMTFALNTNVQSLEKTRRPELSQQPAVGIFPPLGFAADKSERCRPGLDLCAGLFTRVRPDTVFEVEQCWLQDDTSNQILATIKEDITSIQDRVRPPPVGQACGSVSARVICDFSAERSPWLQGRIVIEKIVIRQGQHLKTKKPEYMVVFHTWVRMRATPPTAEEARSA